ncbi:MAG TPA: hypothetical protein VIT20_06810 [Propionibacteriaceae bacterium]
MGPAPTDRAIAGSRAVRSRWPKVGAAAATLLVLAGGCTTPVDSPPPGRPDNPPQRTSWVLRHRVVDSGEIQVRGSSMSQYEESTSVAAGLDANGDDRSCSVTISVPGWGGPENKVGEKLPTKVQGHPGFRSGAGAEYVYVMWQLPDEAWVEVNCTDPDDPAPVESLAKAVRLETTAIALPYAVDLPEGYGVALILQELDNTKVYVGPVNPAFGLPDAQIEISYETKDPLHTPSGRAITVGGRPALLNENERSPEVCVLDGARHVCVDAYTTDTGPYPDRTGEIPTLIALAESLRFADDLDDRSTWFPADVVFG